MKITRVGVNIVTNVFQIHGVDRSHGLHGRITELFRVWPDGVWACGFCSPDLPSSRVNRTAQSAVPNELHGCGGRTDRQLGSNSDFNRFPEPGTQPPVKVPEYVFLRHEHALFESIAT